MIWKILMIKYGEIIALEDSKAAPHKSYHHLFKELVLNVVFTIVVQIRLKKDQESCLYI